MDEDEEDYSCPICGQDPCSTYDDYDDKWFEDADMESR